MSQAAIIFSFVIWINGVDGLTWGAYEAALDSNLADLHSRLHRGVYRALLSRRVYIPKPDGRQRPLAVAALEDKIVQRALERGIAIHLDLLGGGQCRSDFGWLKRCNECACHGVDLHAANVEAVAAAPLDKMLAGAVISRCRITAAIMRAQTAAAVPATGEAL